MSINDTTEGFDYCSLCLFCYKPITQNTGEKNLANNCDDTRHVKVDCDLSLSKEKENGVVERFIKFLDRIGEPSKILSKYCGTERNAGVISCCNECGSVIDSFWDAYHQWKCLELKLEWRLGTIVNIMKFANKVPSRVKRLKRSFGKSLVDGGVGGDFKNFKNFRGNLIKKCAQTLSNTQPRVLLERSGRRNPSDNSEIREEPSNVNCKNEDQDCQHLQEAPPATPESQALFVGWSLSLAAVAGLASTNEDVSKTRFTTDDQRDAVALSPLVSPVAEILELYLEEERDDADYGDNSINDSSRQPEVETINKTDGEAGSRNLTQATMIIHGVTTGSAGATHPPNKNKDSIQPTVQTRDIEVKEEEEPENVENESHSPVDFTSSFPQNLPITTEHEVSQDPLRNQKFTPNSRFECPHCSYPYYLEWALKKHINKEHPSLGIVGSTPRLVPPPPPIRKKRHLHHCSICNFSCTNWSQLLSHKQSYKHQYLAKLFRKTVKTEQGAHSKIVTSDSKKSRVSTTPTPSKAANEAKILAKRGDRYFCKICKYSTPSYDCLLTHKRSQSHQRRSKLFSKKRRIAKVSNDVKVEEVASPTEESAGPEQVEEVASRTEESAGLQQLVEEPPPAPPSPPQRYNLRQKKVPSYRNMEEEICNDEKIISCDNHSNSDSDSSSETDVTSEDDESVEEKPVVEKVPKKRHRKSCRLDDCSSFEIVIEKYLFKQHQQLHNPGEYKCNFCDTIESNVIRLSCHEREFHPAPLANSRNSEGKEIFPCPRCNYTTKRRQSYYWHFAEVHVGGFQRILNKEETVTVPTVECEICKLTIQKNNLDKHLKRNHDTKNWTGRIWRCDQDNCPAYFKNVNQRRNHRKNVHGINSHTLEFDPEEDSEEAKNLKCNLCDKKFNSLISLKRHKSVFHRKQGDAGTTPVTPVTVHLGHKVFICPVVHCAEKFKSSENLENHKKLHGTFHCDFCSVTKNYAPELALHELEHATSSKNVFNCSRCSYDCEKKSIYVRHHLRTHLNLKFGKFTCPICKVGGAQKEFLHQHMKVMHNTEGLDPSKIFRCDQCPAYFIRSNQLVSHKMKIHVGGSYCSICERNYSNPLHLRLHLERAHPETLPNLKFSCDKIPCKRRFGTREELDSHKKIHEDEKEYNRPVKCPDCGKQIKRKCDLKKHMEEVHSGRSHMCPECGKAFKAKRGLDRHLEYHKGPELWRFQCAECGRKCVTRQKLNEHLRTHSKEKPFVCQYCGQKYAQRKDWKAHVKTKHPEEFEKNEEPALERTPGEHLSRKGFKKGDCILSGAQHC